MKAPRHTPPIRVEHEKRKNTGRTRCDTPRAQLCVKNDSWTFGMRSRKIGLRDE
jgi:hypothetical protein